MDTNVETIKLYPIEPWLTPFKTYNLKKEKGNAQQAIREPISSATPKNIIVFTDGSKIPGKVNGEAEILYPSGKTITQHIEKNTRVSNYEMEMIGVLLAVEDIRGRDL
ncbi:hypothetical protein O181_073479 [Austropuccinia psidii MF-1]|uniref:RNase H type-1 domain-containing protein n=1 Tax=Austropuccinia psidii MF-1 TaxID=1389203 RepID=A0A9Q3F765_9BASI|nr:hypothetical protein [Austropuccinia psidii MF-1]